ncbi:MAG: DNA-directed RNA polymerase subunit alpha [Gloeomargarita sp. SKYBB_i_bin120]|nr:DNA-directed RNA polymerase subunit alpha [Gloeomargarita sp. SKYG98]MCS7293266.1 DNA-directed RNA polymerase subunit alpha [Gloeomargarita sp. SKYB120]MDW8178830.1 DNA-directed RNA polymerase subunit alpha [Gloeomargarita sp. SKYBB_i_bin120]
MAQFKVEVVETSGQQQYGRFVLEPLHQGQGTTVGNALRRVLLGDLEGAAITAVHIEGVTHEFSTVPGLREDVLELMLNLKEVVLRSHSPERQLGRLERVQGPMIITAGHLKLPPEVEVVHPTQYIATLAEGHTLEMEFYVERGRGYRLQDGSRKDNTSVDFLQIDAVFMPVRRVNWQVEEFRGEDGFLKDRLILEVTTDGSISPKEAVSQAAHILVDLFAPLRTITGLEPVDSGQTSEEDKIGQIPIEELQLSVRAYNCLKRAQIHTVADLLNYSQEELLEIKNFGQKSAEEVIEALQNRLGIVLPKEKA